ncbi:MAG: GNAT family N-acetyltransferase [Pirellula sp.]|nr:GNAT family N-acetyltransferase [Pirellula sp.]
MNQPVNWQPCSPPEPIELTGNYCQLEPMRVQHANDLFDASMASGFADRFRYLTIEPQSREEFSKWLDQFSKSSDPLYFSVIDLKTKRCEGRQSLMRIDCSHGVIEIGNILWGPAFCVFEGIFRQHMVVKGYNRDTAWFSMLDSEWEALRKRFTSWLASENFDSQGMQRSRLKDFRIQ